MTTTEHLGTYNVPWRESEWYMTLMFEKALPKVITTWVIVQSDCRMGQKYLLCFGKTPTLQPWMLKCQRLECRPLDSVTLADLRCVKSEALLNPVRCRLALSFSHNSNCSLLLYYKLTIYELLQGQNCHFLLKLVIIVSEYFIGYICSHSMLSDQEVLLKAAHK